MEDIARANSGEGEKGFWKLLGKSYLAYKKQQWGNQTLSSARSELASILPQLLLTAILPHKESQLEAKVSIEKSTETELPIESKLGWNQA